MLVAAATRRKQCVDITAVRHCLTSAVVHLLRRLDMPITSIGLAAVMCRLSPAVPSATHCAFLDRSARVLDRTATAISNSSPRLRGCAGRRSTDVTERVFVAMSSGAFLAKSPHRFDQGAGLESQAQLQGIRVRRRYGDDGRRPLPCASHPRNGWEWACAVATIHRP